MERRRDGDGRDLFQGTRGWRRTDYERKEEGEEEGSGRDESIDMSFEMWKCGMIVWHFVCVSLGIFSIELDIYVGESREQVTGAETRRRGYCVTPTRHYFLYSGLLLLCGKCALVRIWFFSETFGKPKCALSKIPIPLQVRSTDNLSEALITFTKDLLMTDLFAARPKHQWNRLFAGKWLMESALEKIKVPDEYWGGIGWKSGMKHVFSKFENNSKILNFKISTPEIFENLKKYTFCS